MGIMSQKMDDMIEGSLYEQSMMYQELEELTIDELSDRLMVIQYKLDQLNEYGLGDSDCEKQKFFLKIEYDMIKYILEI